MGNSTAIYVDLNCSDIDRFIFKIFILRDTAKKILTCALLTCSLVQISLLSEKFTE